MNIDERLEALTHSVELLASMQRDTESRIGQLAKNHKRLEQLATEIAEGTARLLRIVESHEQRISDLEQGQNPQ